MFLASLRWSILHTVRANLGEGNRVTGKPRTVNEEKNSLPILGSRFPGSSVAGKARVRASDAVHTARFIARAQNLGKSNSSRVWQRFLATSPSRSREAEL